MPQPRDAKPVGVPQVHPRLVPDLDPRGRRQVRKEGSAGPDDAVLGRPRLVGVVKVDEVVVVDARLGGPAGDGVPDGLGDGAGGEVPAGEGHGGGAAQDFEEGGVALDGGAEARGLVGGVGAGDVHWDDVCGMKGENEEETSEERETDVRRVRA